VAEVRLSRFAGSRYVNNDGRQNMRVMTKQEVDVVADICCDICDESTSGHYRAL
jgi:hypothetical protein